MCQIKCPVCKRRICDIITTTNEQVTIEIKCPHCRRIVRIDEDIIRALERKDVSQSALVAAVRARIGG